MKISRMNKGSWGLIKAFFDLQTEEGFTIKGFKLVEGINGLFVGFPSNKNNDGEQLNVSGYNPDSSPDDKAKT